MMSETHAHPKGIEMVEQGAVRAPTAPLDPTEMARDDRDMARLGKRQQFKRNFGWLSITGLTCTLMLTWEGSVIGFGPQLLNGGPAGLFGGFLFAWGGALLQALVMAEMASMVPLSGGQYNWVAALAPPSCSKFLSYMTGWETALTWHATVATIFYLSASAIQTLAAINDSSYVPERWQVTLIMYALMANALLFNSYLGRVLPKIESIVLLIHILGFFIVLVVIVYLTKDKNPSSLVFGDFINGGGWSSNSLSFFVGTVSSILAFVGADAAAHMAEEVESATTVVPWSIVGTIFINGASGFGMLIAMLFVMGDPTKVVEAYLEGQLPFATIFINAVGSPSGAVGVGFIPTLVGCFGSVGVLAAASRMTWAFARENALPGSRWLSRIQTMNALPINAIAVTATIDMLLALINIGSSTAFNAFAGITVQGFFSVFIIVCGVGLYHRITGGKHTRVKKGPFSLGIMGIPITVLALAYSIIGFIFSFWPPLPNPGVDEFNWSIVVYVATIVVALAYWLLRARHVYRGPLVEVQEDFDHDAK